MIILLCCLDPAEGSTRRNGLFEVEVHIIEFSEMFKTFPSTKNAMYLLCLDQADSMLLSVVRAILFTNQHFIILALCGQNILCICSCDNNTVIMCNNFLEKLKPCTLYPC